MIITVVLQFKQLQINPPKNFETGFELMASALALQFSTIWAMKTHTLGAGQFICWVHLNPWKEWNMKMMWTAEMDSTNSVIEVWHYLISLCYFHFLLSSFCVTVRSSCLNFVIKLMDSYLIHCLTTCRITCKKSTCIVMKKELFEFYCSWWSVFTFSVAVVMGATTMPISVTWRDWRHGLNL